MSSGRGLPQPGSPDVVYLIDGASYVYRAFFAVGHLSTSKGAPTGAAFGVVNMLLRLAAEQKPAMLAWVRDSVTPTFRTEIYAEYKAHRPPTPPELKEQFPIVHRLVEAFGLPVLGCDGFEADDVLATIARRAVDRGHRVVIVSGDKDLMQLVGDRIVLLDTMRNAVYDEAAVEEKFGVPPARLGDLLALTGDASDNIPGVEGVGPKTATKLLREYGDLENVLSSTAKMGNTKVRQNLEAQVDCARLSRRLVALKEDVPLEIDFDALRYAPPERRKLLPLLKELEFHKLIAVLDEISVGEAEAEGEPVGEYETVPDQTRLARIAEAMEKAGEFSIDLETTSVSEVDAEIVGISLAWIPGRAVYVPVAHASGENQVPIEEALRILGPLLRDEAIRKIGQNIKYEHAIFMRHGIEIRGWYHDTMLGAYLLQPDRRQHNLDALALEHLGYKMLGYDEVTEKSSGRQLRFDEVAIDRATRYSAEDADITLRLSRLLEPNLEKEGLSKLLREIEVPVAEVLAGMELCGVSVDVPKMKKLSHDLESRILELERKVHELAGGPFNIASPKQLQEVLFTKLGLKTGKKTKTGYSTDSDVLEELSYDHELPAAVLEHRTLSKLKNTYLDALPSLVHPRTGRIHTSYHQAVTATGRLSSADPNLQNIPIRTDLGREIRSAFVAPPGQMLLSADYSQIELRILAHLSADQALITAFREGADVHDRTARAIYHVPEDSPLIPEMRTAAKAINFGVIYGKTDFGLGRELRIPRAEAHRFIEEYFELYGGVKRYMEETIARAHETGEVRTILGRKRPLPELRSSNHVARQQAERMARNSPIQGSAADLLKLAMIRVARSLKTQGLRSRMILTVHDELVFEVPKGEEKAVEAVVREAMEGAMALSVPLVLDVGWGKNWAEAH